MITLPQEIVEDLNSQINAENQGKTEMSDNSDSDTKFEPRFESLNDDDIDEIAVASNAKNTHNQTKWALKVFRGNNFL